MFAPNGNKWPSNVKVLVILLSAARRRTIIFVVVLWIAHGNGSNSYLGVILKRTIYFSKILHIWYWYIL